jgi:hypothetical protein
MPAKLSQQEFIEKARQVHGDRFSKWFHSYLTEADKIA